jgi:hypothetical protein
VVETMSQPEAAGGQFKLALHHASAAQTLASSNCCASLSVASGYTMRCNRALLMYIP